MGNATVPSKQASSQSGFQLPKPQQPGQPLTHPIPAKPAQSSSNGSTEQSAKPELTDAQVAALAVAKDLVNGYVVQLKTDKEGTTEADRNDHLEKVEALCKQNITDAKGTKYAGIEKRLDHVFPCYMGVFHPSVVEVIKKHKVCKFSLLMDLRNHTGS